jgi:uncharacterized SAM-binding protein YcdF (DUF218 family)
LQGQLNRLIAMDLAIKQIISTLLLLPASALILAALGLGLATRRNKAWQRLGVALAATSLTVLWLGSTPMVMNSALRSVENDWQVWQANPERPAEAVVVLGGGRNIGAREYGGASVSGASLQRLRYGIHLAKANRLPVMFTGGNADPGTAQDPALTEAALAQRVARDDFGFPLRWVEATARDTQENAQAAAALLKPRASATGGIRTIVLVTDVWHMPRAVRWFEQEGFLVQPAPMGFAAEADTSFRHWLPSADALAVSNRLLRELLGRAWQALRT